MSARIRGSLRARAGQAGLRVRVDDSGIVIDLVRPRRLARGAGLRGLRGLRALGAIARRLGGAPMTIRVRANGRTLLTAGRGARRVSPYGVALAAVAMARRPWHHDERARDE